MHNEVKMVLIFKVEPPDLLLAIPGRESIAP